MYKDSYVLSVVANGNIVEEDNKLIRLPFGTEYAIRLINKNSFKSAADLHINGEKIARFVIGANETYDIERYIDSDLNKGRRFKFVSLQDSGVKDKKDIDNGDLEVLFFKEIVKPAPIVIKEHHYHHYEQPFQPCYPSRPFPQPIWYNDCEILFGAGEGSLNVNATSCSAAGMCADVGGATVRGSESKQEFKEVSGLEFESTPVILKLKIVNGEVKTMSKYCSGCGRSRRHGDRFCPNCGNKL